MITAIIQARMTSRRLPGKVFLPVCGRPIIDYVFSQLESVPELDKLVLATTTNQADDPLVDYAEGRQISFFRGSEHDVLERFYLAAAQEEASDVMRITSDCPLLDPQICSLVIQTYKNEGVDYVHTGPRFSEGVDCEIFSFEALENAYLNANLQSEREHVTIYFRNHPEKFTRIELENCSDDSRYRFTLDQEEDYRVISAIIEKLIEQKKPFISNHVKTILDAYSDISDINKNVIRNEGLKRSLENDCIVNPQPSSPSLES